MSQYLGKGVAVCDKLTSDLELIQCQECFMSHDFPIDPYRGIVPKDMAIVIRFKDDMIKLSPGEAFTDMKRIAKYEGMELFCRCGSLLRSWGPEDVGFGEKKPKADFGLVEDQMKKGFLYTFT